ncbi:MAG: anthranilate phosphoribosyltransferase [bacterium]|nr:anthranilate phosphoribosyltransferase [bacterium]
MKTIESNLNKLFNFQNLSFNEAESAMNEIMSGNVSDSLLAAWLTSLRMKGETPEEIAGCASSMIKNAIKVNIKDREAVDIVGTGGDTCNTINISTASAIVTAASGISVSKHGNKAVSSNSGSADILSALGLNIRISPDKMVECINTINLAFLFAPTLHPAMRFALPVRQQLKQRTIFNIMGPISNPSGITRALIGVYDEKLCRIIAEAAKKIGYKRLMVVHGNDGLDEITTTSCTKICELKDDTITEYEFNPEQYGIKKSKLKDIQGKSPEYNAEIIKNLFNNKLTGPIKDIIVLNSAAGIIVSGKTNSWSKALDIANKAIEAGKALKKLDEIIQFTNS